MQNRCYFCMFKFQIQGSETKMGRNYFAFCTVLLISSVFGLAYCSCLIETSDETVIHKFTELIALETVEIVRADLIIDKENKPNFKSWGLHLPEEWQIITQMSGQYILTSHPDIEVFSLGTLSLGIKHISIPIKTTPDTCLRNITENAYKQAIVNLLFSGLKTSTQLNDSALPDNVKICSEEAVIRGKLVTFTLECCASPEICEGTLPDWWQEFLFYLIMALNFIVFLYAANLVPEYLYMDTFSYLNFYQTLDKDSSFLVVNITEDDTETIAELDTDILDKPNICNTLTSLTEAIIGERYKIKGIWFKVPLDRLVSKSHLPISLFIFLYQRLVECTCYTYRGHAKSPANLKPFTTTADYADHKSARKDSHEDFSIRICCDLPVCNPQSRVSRCRFPRWSKVLHVVMIIVSCLFLAIPWIIVYAHESQTPEGKRGQFAQDRGLLYSPPFYAFNLLRFLEVHCPELSFACMILYVLCASVLSVILQNDAEESVHVGIHIREALRNAKSRWDHGVMKSSRFLVSLFLPFKFFRNYGLLALLLWPIWIVCVCPVTILIVVLGNTPTVNIFIRLFIVFIKDTIAIFTSRQITKSTLTSLRKCSVYISLIILLFIVHFLVFAFVSLVVNMVAYTLVGIIVSAQSTVRYTAFAVLIILNARDCFLAVEHRYAVFNEKLQTTILSKTQDEVKRLAKHNKAFQVNTAFRIVVEPDKCETQLPESSLWQDLSISDRNKIIWKPKSVVQFLDNDDKLYLSEKFFFDACYMDYYGCPGDFSPNLYYALRQVFLITAFLVFVVFTLVAYGGLAESNSSGLLVTLATGLLPLFVRRFFAKPIPELSLDVDDFNFQNKLESLIYEFTEHWEVVDLDIEKLDKNNDHLTDPDQETHLSLKLGSNHCIRLAVPTDDFYGPEQREEIARHIEEVKSDGIELDVIDPAREASTHRTEDIGE